MYNSNIRKTIPVSKIITDIPHVPQAQITNGTINHYTCNDCNCTTIPKTDSISGTGFGLNILTYITYLWNDRVPLDKIIPFVKDMFDVQCSASTICNALFSTSESLTGMIPQIKQDIASSDVTSYHETGNKISGRNGWTLVAGTRNSTLICYTYGRNSAVIQEHLPMCKKVAICDKHYYIQDISNDSTLLGSQIT